tara:strand:- start:13137 stop:14315 length:1179 start_codon:yes stop_codon:yes gene_type:complete
MDARMVALAVAVLACSLTGASFRTQNFVVTASSPAMAREVAVAAERFRKELADEWLGYQLKPWHQPVPIRVHTAGHLGAGGVTSFVFVDNIPQQWQMTLQGTRQRVLDSVLPHEISHAVFATHFGRPLPRWADEGACTTVEHDSEKKKQHSLLLRYLTTNRGIPFNQMLRMKEYPRDIMTLYSQGFSVSQYLIAYRGKRTFIKFLEHAMDNQDWDEAIRQYYPFQHASDLQTKWVSWVGQGSPQITPLRNQQNITLASAKSSPKQNHDVSQNVTVADEKLVPIGYQADLGQSGSLTSQSKNIQAQVGDGWTSRHKSRNVSRESETLASFSRVIHRGESNKTELSRPRSVNQSQPVILQASAESGVSSRVTAVSPPSRSQQAGGSSLKWVSPR